MEKSEQERLLNGEKIDVRVIEAGSHLNPETFKSSNDRFNPKNRIYVRAMYGRFQQWRKIVATIVIGFFVLIPWLNYHGRQAILLDFSNQKFNFFGTTLLPQDLFLLALFFIIAAYLLFFITTFYGRVWCGYACPQTVWTFLFIWFEEKLEGPANKRRTQDQKPLTLHLRWRKLLKHLCWILIALITAVSFVGFLTPIREIWRHLLDGTLPLTQIFWIGFFTLATYGNAGWMRTIVCTHMCPYARFQSAMFDKDTFIVGYDTKRGEKRGPRSRKDNRAELGLGDCIGCDLCVHVCPAGIDIRDGLQYECINCGACIDACDQTMEKMNYPKGLISYTTENQLSGNKTKLFRFKLVGYGVMLTCMVSLFIYNISTVSPMGIDVIRDRGDFSRLNSDGLAENTYILKLQNKTQTQRKYELSVSGVPEGSRWYGKQEIVVKPSSVASLPISIGVKPDALDSSVHTIQFIMKDNETHEEMMTDSRFIH